MNFASELSDLRHRHGFHVILVHKTQASPALLQHAHLHVLFEDFVSELPPRMLVKSQVFYLNPRAEMFSQFKHSPILFLVSGQMLLELQNVYIL